jgi:hypothetical protein
MWVAIADVEIPGSITAGLDEVSSGLSHLPDPPVGANTSEVPAKSIGRSDVQLADHAGPISGVLQQQRGRSDERKITEMRVAVFVAVLPVGVVVKSTEKDATTRTARSSRAESAGEAYAFGREAI